MKNALREETKAQKPDPKSGENTAAEHAEDRGTHDASTGLAEMASKENEMPDTQITEKPADASAAAAQEVLVGETPNPNHIPSAAVAELDTMKQNRAPSAPEPKNDAEPEAKENRALPAVEAGDEGDRHTPPLREAAPPICRLEAGSVFPDLTNELKSMPIAEAKADGQMPPAEQTLRASANPADLDQLSLICALNVVSRCQLDCC